MARKKTTKVAQVQVDPQEEIKTVPGTVTPPLQFGQTLAKVPSPGEISTVPGVVTPPDIQTVPGVVTPPAQQVETVEVAGAAQAPAPLTAEELERRERLAQEGIIERGLQKTVEVGERFGVFGKEEKRPETIGEVVEEFKTRQQEEADATARRFGTQDVLARLQQERLERQTAGAKSAAVASLAQGREGAVSGTAPQTARAFVTELDRQLDENKIRLESARASRQDMLRQFERAQKEGRTDLAKRLERSLAAADQEIKTNQANLINAQNQQFEQARLAQAAKRQNIESFAGLVNRGTILNKDGLVSMSEQLNLPFKLVNDYYEGAQAIRDDKRLTLEEKEAKLGDLKFNFDLEQQGFVTQQAKQIKGITDLMKAGKISEQEAEDLFTGLGIESSMNPLTRIKAATQQADLKAKQVGLQFLPAEKRLAIQRGQQQLRLGDLDEMIKGAQAAGASQKVILDLKQSALDLQKSQLELNELRPDAGVGIQTGRFDQAVPAEKSVADSSLGRGTITGYGSSLNDKGLDFVLEGGPNAPVSLPFGFEVIEAKKSGGWGNRVKVRSLADGQEIWISHLNNFGNIQAGQQYNAGTVIGTQGNTGSVLGSRGEALSAAQVAAGRGTHLDITMPKAEGGFHSSKEVASYLGVGQERKVSPEAILSDAFRFAVTTPTKKDKILKGKTPEQQKSILAVNRGDWTKLLPPEKSKFTEALRMSLSGKFKDEDVSSVSKVAEDLQGGNTESAKREVIGVLNNRAFSATQKDTFNRNTQLMKDMVTLGRAFKSLQDKTGIVAGNIEDLNQRLGATTDPELARTKVLLDRIVQKYTKQQTGVAASDVERQRYEALFPGLKNFNELNMVKAQSVHEFTKNDLNRLLNSTTGGNITEYAELLPENELESTYWNDPRQAATGPAAYRAAKEQSEQDSQLELEAF